MNRFRRNCEEVVKLQPGDVTSLNRRDFSMWVVMPDLIRHPETFVLLKHFNVLTSLDSGFRLNDGLSNRDIRLFVIARNGVMKQSTG
jgi:hypothetical protein